MGASANSSSTSPTDTGRLLKGIQLRRTMTSSGAVTFGETADLCTETVDGTSFVFDKLDNDNTRLLIAGGFAGCIGKTITAPLSRLTILFQVHSMVSNAKSEQFSSSLVGACKKVFRNEGLIAFWKGNGTSVVHRFPYSAINFLSYEKVRASFNEDVQGTPFCRFISGAVAGATATIACYPLDLIRTRLATQQDVNIRYRGISHAVYRIWTEESYRGLYRGLGTTLLVTVPNLAINFTIYGTLKDWRMKNAGNNAAYNNSDKNSVNNSASNSVNNSANSNNAEHKVGVAESLICGAIAGIASSLITFPIDVVRRRMQLQGIHNVGDRIIGSKFIAMELFSDQGIRGFYRGLVPELVKVVPMVGITFVSFEQIKDALGIE